MNQTKPQTKSQSQTIDWNFTHPPENLRTRRLQLLTIAGISIKGVWCGQLGQHYIAWSEPTPTTQTTSTSTSTNSLNSLITSAFSIYNA
jgi:hypothetical protein